MHDTDIDNFMCNVYYFDNKITHNSIRKLKLKNV